MANFSRGRMLVSLAVKNNASIRHGQNKENYQPAVNNTHAQPAVNNTQPQPAVNNTQPQPAVNNTQPQPAVNNTQPQPAVNNTQPQPAVKNTQPQPAVNNTHAQPAVNNTHAQPAVNNTKPQPAVNNTQPQPAVNNTQPQPAVNNTQPQPAVNNAQPAFNNAQPAVNNTQPQPAVNNTHAQPAVNNTKPQPAVNNTQPQPAVNNAQPAVNNAQPAVNNARPAVNNANEAPGNQAMDLQENQPPAKRPRTNADRAVHNRSKYILLPPCDNKCRKKCMERLNENNDTQRQDILSTYWGLTFALRRGFLDANVTISGIQQRKGAADGPNEAKRNHTLSYTLPMVNGTKLSVCKTMFMHTLGLKTDGIITEFVKTKVGVENIERSLSPTTDYRGKHVPQHKFDWDKIRRHVNSYHPQISHYNREHAPNRRYLEPNLNITDMWKDFIEKHEDISYELYRQVFKDENIGFGEPSQDECAECLDFRRHEKEGVEDHVAHECEQCSSAKSHLERARKARHEYQKESPEGHSVYAVDMQKVLLLPKLPTKESFFVSRLVVFNETFANFSDDRPDYAILWHEGIAGRKCYNVASSFVKCIVLDSSPKIIFWSDNCTGQNKNWTLYTAMVQCINSEWGPENITIKYLVKGHTFMKADSVHGAIGRKMKRAESIYTFDDFVQICQTAGKNIVPVIMNASDFYEFSGQQQQRARKINYLPLLSEVCEVKFTKGSRGMEYKLMFNEEYKHVDFLRPKFNINVMPDTQNLARGIPIQKKNAILKLMRVAPAAKIKFWQELLASEVDDLVEYE